MKTVRMILEEPPGHQWTVSDDDGNIEVFSCPIQALLRAKHRFHRIPATEMAMLWVSMDGTEGTPLLVRELREPARVQQRQAAFAA